MGAARGIALAVLVLAACTRHEAPFSPVESTRIAQVALRALFVDREDARSVLLWTGSLADAPTFGQKRLRSAATSSLVVSESLTLAHLDTATLRLPVPVHAVDPALLDRHFREYPDGWDAWFRRFPGASGIVEVTAPVRRSGGAAALLVARACGEHCHSAWRVVLSRDTTGTWRVDSTVALALPRS
ncbi:MAG TPA: hypothetical protein VE869_10120 [Gemmatimonas sp.]|nr:hypothetical protein [Gemmatimonas sp.]